MSTISIKNPPASQNNKTFVSQEYTSGTTLYVDSSTGFSDGNYILAGEPGLESSEVANLTATPPTSTSLTITSLNFSHARGIQVYQISWDKYSLEYRATSSDSWSTYASMPANLRYDSISTEYRDASATSTYQWRYRYYSSENSAYSDYSDTISATGWPSNSVGYMVREVRKIIGDPESKTVTDTEIIRFFNKAQDKIYALYDRWWFLLKIGTAIDTEVSTKDYDLPSDFGRLHSVLFRYINGASDISYNLKHLPMVEFDYVSRDNTASDNDEVKYYTIYLGDSNNTTGYLYIWPTPETAGLDMTPRYYKTFTALDSFADTTEVPIPSMLEDYALAEIYKIRKEENIAEYYDKLFREQVDLLKLEQRKQVGSPRALWRYAGRDAERRLFGTRSIINNDADKENFF